MLRPRAFLMAFMVLAFSGARRRRYGSAQQSRRVCFLRRAMMLQRLGGRVRLVFVDVAAAAV